MPKYDYQCAACGAMFEVEQRISDEPLKVCEKCGKEELRRLISSGVGVINKGVSSAPPPACQGGACSSGSCPYAE